MTSGEMSQYPEQGTVYKVGNKYYLVYTYDLAGKSITGELPVAWTIDAAEAASLGGIKTVDPEKWKKTGALVMGPAANIRNTTGDPLESIMAQFEREAKVRPWMRDPTALAIMVAAALEGRSVTEAEWAQTDWWQENNEAQRQWMILSEGDPKTADRMLSEKTLEVREAARAAGIKGLDNEIAKWLARKTVSGDWGEAKLAVQLRKLSDPYAPGRLDKELTAFIKDVESGNVDTTRDMEDEVRALAREWLGPRAGNVDDKWVKRWAGKLRNDPDAQTELEEKLRERRMRLLPQYTDEFASYEDIASMWRPVWRQTLGENADEVGDGAWMKFMKMNDDEQAGQYLRNLGMERGNKKVTRDAMMGMLSAFGMTQEPV